MSKVSVTTTILYLSPVLAEFPFVNMWPSGLTHDLVACWTSFDLDRNLLLIANGVSCIHWSCIQSNVFNVFLIISQCDVIMPVYLVSVMLEVRLRKSATIRVI